MTLKVSYAAYPTFLLRVAGLPLVSRLAIPDQEKNLGSFIPEHWENPLIRGAIELASPGLANEIRLCIREDREVPKAAQLSFLNYFIRFCTRTTPFGLFAGVVSGNVVSDGVNAFDLLPLTQGLVHLRLDMEYLVRQVKTWTTDPEVMRFLKFYPNTSLYRVGNQYRYILAEPVPGRRPKYRLESCEWEQFLEETIASCRNGKSLDELVLRLVQEGYSHGEARAFLYELIRAQFLVSDLEPVLTGMEYPVFLSGRLQDGKIPGDQVASVLQQIEKLRKPVKPEEVEETCLQVSSALQEKSGTSFDFPLLQGDLLRRTRRNHLDQGTANRVLFGIRLLKALKSNSLPDSLGEFKVHFRRRFQSRKIPLLEALDLEFGVGLQGPMKQQNADPSGLLDDLHQYGQPGGSGDSSASPFGKDLPGLYSPGEQFYEISKEHVKQLQINEGPWHPQMYALFSLIGSDGPTQIYLPMAAAGNPIYLLARFGFLPDAGIEKLLQELSHDEIVHCQDAILADLIHLPESRTGNILQRPSCYSFEIPLLAQSLKDGERQINLEDLLVSVDQDAVCISHRRTGQRIHPRLSNAHNYNSGQLAVYEFLIECGKQTGSAIYSIQQQLAPRQGFIPGIRYQDLIFRLPEWRLALGAVQEMIRKKPGEKVQILKNWAKEAGMPNEVQLKNGDRPVYIHWESPLLVEAAWMLMKKKKIVQFEWFPYASGSPVQEDTHSLANQFIVCFHQTK